MCNEKLNKLKVYRKKPVNLIPEDDYLFINEYEKHIKTARIKKLNNVYISESKLKKFKYIRFNSQQWRMNPLTSKDKVVYFLSDIKSLFFNKNKLENIKIIRKAIWAIDSRSYQYFHWLTDALQRIQAANKYLKEYPVLLLPDFENFNYIKKSLNILGIDSYVLEPGEFYLVEQLILSERVSPAGNYRKNLINDISNNFIEKNKKLKNEISFNKIWITRQYAEKRKILNFNEIKPILENHNFKIVQFENLSFEDQISISNNCEVMGGVHGAGLTNMIFMNKKSRVIEVRSKGDSSNNCFFSLASDMEHDYFYFLAKPTSNNFYETNLYIDPILFDNFLKNNNF